MYYLKHACLLGVLVLASALLALGQDRDSSDTRWTDIDTYDDVDIPFIDDEMPVYAGNWVSNAHPFRMTALYRPLSAVRYNRVEGPVLGIGVKPLSWKGDNRRRLYGSLGYAFQLKQWQYELGAESRMQFTSNTPIDLGLKFGASFYRTIGTNDRWKVDFGENSLAAVVFRNDFLDYYEIDGWTVYGVKQLPVSAGAQISLGYRSDDYASLTKSTDWSLFRDNAFRGNPAVHEGRMHSIIAALDGGQVDDFNDWPQGSVLRLEAEFGDGLGGDFSFNQYTAGGAFYRPFSKVTALHVRLMGGYTAGQVPAQKEFTIGGVGSAIGYPQNRYAGSRMVLADAEFVLRDVFFIVEDLQVFASGDVGWIGRENDSWMGEDGWLASIGGGISLDERLARFEIGWPVVNSPNNGPVIWFRLHPSF